MNDTDKRLVFHIIFIYRYFKCYLMLNFTCILYLSWKIFHSNDRNSTLFYIFDSYESSVIRFPSLIMPITNMKWGVEFRSFNATSEARFIKKKFFVFCFFNFGFCFVLILLILFACGDTELYPGPKKMNYCYIIYS